MKCHAKDQIQAVRHVSNITAYNNQACDDIEDSHDRDNYGRYLGYARDAAQNDD